MAGRGADEHGDGAGLLPALTGARAGQTRLEAVGLRLLGPMARGVASIPEGLKDAREGVKLRGTLLDE